DQVDAFSQALKRAFTNRRGEIGVGIIGPGGRIEWLDDTPCSCWMRTLSEICKCEEVASGLEGRLINPAARPLWTCTSITQKRLAITQRGPRGSPCGPPRRRHQGRRSAADDASIFDVNHSMGEAQYTRVVRNDQHPARGILGDLGQERHDRVAVFAVEGSGWLIRENGRWLSHDGAR